MKCANTKVCSLRCQISLYHGTKRCLTHLCSCLKSLVTTSSCEVSARTCCPCAMCRSSAAWKYTYSKVRLRVWRKDCLKNWNIQLQWNDEVRWEKKREKNKDLFSRTFPHHYHSATQLELPPSSKMWTSTSVRWHNVAPLTFHSAFPRALTPVLGGRRPTSLLLIPLPPWCKLGAHKSFLPSSPAAWLVQTPNRSATPGQETQAAMPTGGFGAQQAEGRQLWPACGTHRALSRPHLFVVAATARLRAACSCGLSACLSHNIPFSSPWLKEGRKIRWHTPGSRLPSTRLPGSQLHS